MRDGLTERLTAEPGDGGIAEFLVRFEPKIVLLSGHAAGSEWRIRGERLMIGRGPGVDLAFDVPAMSRQHAAVEFAGRGFRIRDLGSTNGVIVNGNRMQVSELNHGDRFEIGGEVFQLVIDEREQTPDTYEITSEV